MTEFSQINVPDHTKDSGSTENTKQENCQKSLHVHVLFLNYRK